MHPGFSFHETEGSEGSYRPLLRKRLLALGRMSDPRQAFLKKGVLTSFDGIGIKREVKKNLAL